MTRELGRGDYAILRHLPAAGRMFSPQAIRALADTLERRLVEQDDDVLAQAVDRAGWRLFERKYPATARALQRRLPQAIGPALAITALNFRAFVQAKLAGLLGLVERATTGAAMLWRKLEEHARRMRRARTTVRPKMSASIARKVVAARRSTKRSP